MRNDYETPDALFRALDEEFRFTLDACASAGNAKCARYFDEGTNGLWQVWDGETVFCNPPYDDSSLRRWMCKALAESQRGATVVCLVPVRAEQDWWHDYAMEGSIRFIRGRLHFRLPGCRPKRSPFASAIVIFRRPSPTRGRVTEISSYPAMNDPLAAPPVVPPSPRVERGRG